MYLNTIGINTFNIDLRSEIDPNYIYDLMEYLGMYI